MNNSREDISLRILSLDSGGCRGFSQLLVLKELMRLIANHVDIEEEDVYPADYFDLMGGVGSGGIIAVLLGRLRMTVSEVMDCFITTTVFAEDPDGKANPEANTRTLKSSIAELLKARNVPPNAKMSDSSGPVKCKVVLYTGAETDSSRVNIFRTYHTNRSSLNPTIVEALSATMATHPFFSPVKFGPSGKEQMFIGGPLGANNPTRELLKEAYTVFGHDQQVAQIISLGAGRTVHTSLAPIDPADALGRHLRAISSDCERVASELAARLGTLSAYVRINMDSGMEIFGHWSGIDAIKGQTKAYLQTAVVVRTLEESIQSLRNRTGTITLGEIIACLATDQARERRNDHKHRQFGSDVARKKQTRSIRSGTSSCNTPQSIGTPSSDPTIPFTMLKFITRPTKPITRLLLVPYGRAQRITEIARHVDAFHMQSFYIALQALHLVVLLNEHVDEERGPNEEQQDERIVLGDELMALEDAMKIWGRKLTDGDNYAECHLEIKRQYAQFFRERFYFREARDRLSDHSWKKLEAYDRKTVIYDRCNKQDSDKHQVIFSY